MENIRVLFVLPQACTDEREASEVMQQAYESCRQNVVNVSWIEESKFDTTDFSKTDFVVFQEFKDKNFESLKKSKCARILGPWCVLICLMEGRPIPNFTWPIYNVAMSGVVVTCSHITKGRKLQIKEKVQLMGGCYTDSLMSTNTHLITESVKSEKYLQAAETGLKLFVSDYVDAVWEASQINNIHCNDEQFIKYKCPPFHNLTISSTGFPNVEMRTQIAQIVAQHGGIFTANLTITTTDILIVHGESGLASKKFKAARTIPNIFCVNLNWIHDSIAKGYALPHNLYTVTNKLTSTPTKYDDAMPNFSIISAIGDLTQRRPATFDDTLLSKKLQPTSLFTKRISPNKRKGSNSEEIGKIIDGLDIKKAKRAGQYLDGCSVYLAGFKPDEREKLSKILNLSGATRYDDISDRLTHIIVGDSTCQEVKIIKSKNYAVSLVSLHWLLESMEKQKICDEESYLINLHDSDREQFSSPLGKKGLSLLRSKKTITSIDVEVANTTSKDSQEMEIEDDVMQQYLKPPAQIDDSDTLVRLLQNNSEFNSRPNESVTYKATDLSTDASENTQDSSKSQDTNIFFSKKFLVINFSPEKTEIIKDQIESVLGKIMSKTYKGIPDYVIAPAFIKTPIQVSALEVVNDFWITECIKECEELPVAYYHRPMVITDSKPLEDSVVGISGHSSYERIFLSELIQMLGGLSQERFSRISCAEKDIKACTHLVSMEADGKKYVAALKWGLPVVSREWLLECAKSGRLEPEEKFLMGDSKAPVRRSSIENLPSTSKTKDTPVMGTPNHRNSSSFRRVLTPLSQMSPLDISRSEKAQLNVKTPVNQKLIGGVAETPFSQVTPINKLMEEVRKTNLLGTPQTPTMPKTWYDVDTPESPFGAFIKPHLSPNSKKELMRYINQIPDFVPPKERRKSTPLSEVKRRCWQKLLGTQESSNRFPENKTASSSSIQLVDNLEHNEDQNEMETDVNERNMGSDSQTNDEDIFVNTKLKQIEAMVSAFSENRRSSTRRTFVEQEPTEGEVGKVTMKDSQPFTVGWDYEEDLGIAVQEKVRMFIISGVESDQRQSYIEKIEHLGGQVSELNSYDPKCTHLICPKPARNEKTLSCMAAGKWILHISYIDKCIASGKFLPEEDFEFGSSKAKENITTSFDKENETRIQSIHWWRKEISRRGYGAFNDMRAIVVAQKKDPIIRVIEAGGGQVVEATPPFSDNIHATHCLLEVRSVPDFSVYNPLAKQGILCINTLYISDFLYRTNKDIKDAVLPHFSTFYS